MTRTIQRIVVATDGSSSAQGAVETAVEIAEAEEATITFLHVVAPTDFRLARGVSHPRPRVLDSRGDRVLEDAVGVAHDHGVACNRSLVSGLTSEVIAGVAEEVEADLVVVGSRRRPFPLPSVSRSLLRRVSRPLLVAPPRANTAA